MINILFIITTIIPLGKTGGLFFVFANIIGLHFMDKVSEISK